jgi:hypothetical protein
VLFLDEAPSREDGDAVRVPAEHNVPVVLLGPHLPDVMPPVDLWRVRRFKALLSAKFHQMARDRVYQRIHMLS